MFAGAASFGLAFLGMIVGSLVAPNRKETEVEYG